MKSEEMQTEETQQEKTGWLVLIESPANPANHRERKFKLVELLATDAKSAMDECGDIPGQIIAVEFATASGRNKILGFLPSTLS